MLVQKRPFRGTILLHIAAFVVLLLTISSKAQEIRVDGTVVGIGGRFAGVTRPFRLIVNNLTPAGQVSELNQVLRSDGQDGLVKVLSHMNAGRITVGNGVGVRANAVIAERWGNGGTKLTVFYERNISFYEIRAGSRSEDYKIGYAEIFLDGRGQGQGTFIPAARVRLRDGNTWEVEDFGVYPAKLMGLRSTGPLLR